MGNCLSGNAATYPGNKRVAKPAYQPSDGEFKKVNSTTAVADAHFVTCPGGNALKLVGKPNRTEVPVGAEGLAKYISVTLPPGVQAGDIIHVRAPDGRLNAIAVPAGMGPGSTFTVEFSGDISSPLKEEDLTPGVYVPTVVAEPEIETAMPYGGTQGGATAVAQPMAVPYVPAYAAK